MSRLIFKNVFDTLAKYPDIELSVNFHLDDLYNTEMMQMIEDILSKHNEYAHRLTFEILEDKEIFDYEKVNSVFSKLKVFGSKIAIDDFGSGYANYNYLIKLDIDLLKIDGSIIKELLNNPTKTKKVISSIKQLADSLGYEVIAEFVAEQKVYDYMLELDIKYSQGFYLGEPKPISEYVD
jgi:EAL domain-containing protein (putative c-di-GMP-specific phosphodiesterase class I)